MFIVLFGLGQRVSLGEVLYNQRCITCHRDNNNLIPPAPLFKDYRIKAEYVVKILKEGVEGTAMTPFNDLSEKEIYELAKYIENISAKGVKVDTSLIMRGRYVYENVCSPCHGINGDGKGLGNTVPPPPDFTKFNPLPGTTIKILNKGIPGTNMYSFKDILTDEDKEAVANYILLFFDE
ncbi:MAG: c-type cytochrome [candidate division WOR-3 bacterium]